MCGEALTCLGFGHSERLLWGFGRAAFRAERAQVSVSLAAGEQSLVRHTPLWHASCTSREARINPIMLSEAWPGAADIRKDEASPRNTNHMHTHTSHALLPSFFLSLRHLSRKVFSSKIKYKCNYKSTGFSVFLKLCLWGCRGASEWCCVWSIERICIVLFNK